MNKRTIIIAVGALVLGLASAGRDVARENPASFQLVYESDNRGYYRPCG